MERFRGRVALVTGASAGIGEAIARQLTVDHGMKVVGCARRHDRLHKLEKEFSGKAKLMYNFLRLQVSLFIDTFYHFGPRILN